MLVDYGQLVGSLTWRDTGSGRALRAGRLIQAGHPFLSPTIAGMPKAEERQ